MNSCWPVSQEVDGGERPGSKEGKDDAGDKELGRANQANPRPMQRPGALDEVHHGQVLGRHEQEERDGLGGGRRPDHPEEEGDRERQDVEEPPSYP